MPIPLADEEAEAPWGHQPQPPTASSADSAGDRPLLPQYIGPQASLQLLSAARAQSEDAPWEVWGPGPALLSDLCLPPRVRGPEPAL